MWLAAHLGSCHSRCALGATLPEKPSLWGCQAVATVLSGNHVPPHPGRAFWITLDSRPEWGELLVAGVAGARAPAAESLDAQNESGLSDPLELRMTDRQVFRLLWPVATQVPYPFGDITVITTLFGTIPHTGSDWMRVYTHIKQDRMRRRVYLYALLRERFAAHLLTGAHRVYVAGPTGNAYVALQNLCRIKGDHPVGAVSEAKQVRDPCLEPCVEDIPLAKRLRRFCRWEVRMQQCIWVAATCVGTAFLREHLQARAASRRKVRWHQHATGNRSLTCSGVYVVQTTWMQPYQMACYWDPYQVQDGLPAGLTL